MLADGKLQAGIYSRLDAQLSQPVYDFVPQNATSPYVRIGTYTAVQWDTKSVLGQEFTFTVHVFSKASGAKEAQDIQEAIYTALNRQEANVTVTGFVVVLLEHEFSTVQRDETGFPGGERYYHGIQRFRVIVQSA